MGLNIGADTEKPKRVGNKNTSKVMKDFTVAINSDGRIEAFYIDETGTVVHTWQQKPGDTPDLKTSWSAVTKLNGQGHGPLTNVVSLGADSNLQGKIQVVAETSDGKLHVCYQTVNGPWQGWFDIKQG